jgi:hypothetical protein
LANRYFLKEEEADAFKDFMLPMLELFPERRASAQQCLYSYWLKMAPQAEWKMSPEQVANYLETRKPKQEEFSHLVSNEANEAQTIWAGCEDNDELTDETDSSFEDDRDNEYGFPILDRSFRTVYTGYAHGIKIGELDQTANWQFSYSQKK